MVAYDYWSHILWWRSDNKHWLFYYANNWRLQVIKPLRASRQCRWKCDSLHHATHQSAYGAAQTFARINLFVSVLLKYVSASSVKQFSFLHRFERPVVSLWRVHGRRGRLAEWLSLNSRAVLSRVRAETQSILAAGGGYGNSPRLTASEMHILEIGADQVISIKFLCGTSVEKWKCQCFCFKPGCSWRR